MNAAAKMIHQSTIFSGQFSDFRFSKAACLQFTLVIAVLISALSVVYITNLHRMTYSQVQAVQQQEHQLQLHWGQLLLEQASLETPARVQQIATEKLNMRLPGQKHVFTIRTP